MFFSKTVLCLSSLLCLAAAVPAVPAPRTSPMDKRWDVNQRFWQHTELHPSFIDFFRRQAPGEDTGACDLRSAKLPSAPKPLPAPSKELNLAHVVVGRGTQNYTCDTTNSTAVPVAAGALASLFNVSCIAADSPSLLDRLPVISLNLPIPSASSSSGPVYNDLIGHHYFLDATTPFFNLNTALHQYGDGSFKKANATPAPDDAYVGQMGKGFGAVAWLKLDAKTDDGQTMQEVYRVNTAGGNPPKTCAGQAATFTVDYAAEYWIYTK